MRLDRFSIFVDLVQIDRAAFGDSTERFLKHTGQASGLTTGRWIVVLFAQVATRLGGAATVTVALILMKRAL